MIIDTAENLKKYPNIPHVEKIIGFIESTNLSDLSLGDIMLSGEDLYVKVLRYIPQKPEENNFEIHNMYTDVQFIVKGAEIIQTAPRECFVDKPEHKIEGDSCFFSCDKYISEIVLQKGQFAVFFPGEAHRPGCRYQGLETEVMKLVFKTRL